MGVAAGVTFSGSDLGVTAMLTEIQVKNAKPKAKAYKLTDERGLFLLVTPNGGKWWRFKYRFNDKEKLISLGTYPDASLKVARAQRDDARALLVYDKDPSAERTANKEQSKRDSLSTFDAAAKGWLTFKSKSWAKETERKARFVVNDYLIPAIGSKSIATMGSKDVSSTLIKIAGSAPNLAFKARQYIGGIIRYAQREGLRDESRALPLGEILPSFEKGHIPAATTPAEIAVVIKAVNAYTSPVTRAALLTCAYTALRPSIVVSMRWDEIHDDEWHIPGPKMKMKFSHIVPLPRQQLALLELMRAYTARKEYVFPPLARQKSPHLSRDTMSKAMRDMGLQGKAAPHGFRGTLRTVARERLGVDMDILESQLAHAKKGDVQKAYDRTTFNDERRRVMQMWADYLDDLREGRNVIRAKFGKVA